MFIVSPRIGLCNQLQTIVKGICLSIKYNRDLYIDKFQIDLTSNELTDINNILDIQEINKYLKYTIKTPIKILDTIDTNIIDNIHNYFLPSIDYKKIPKLSYINNYIELNKNMEIIYLGNIVSLDIYQSFNFIWNDYTNKNLYYLIMSNIKFNQIFYTLKEYIKQKLKLNNFNCIHLRIEDDALKHFSYVYNLPLEKYNENLINFYDNTINILGEKKNYIYICSGMLEFHNEINFNYYNNLIENNILLCDKKNISLEPYYMHNRELIAIIDLLIAFDSDFFVGSSVSSFSRVIETHHNYNKKQSILFNQ